MKSILKWTGVLSRALVSMFVLADITLCALGGSRLYVAPAENMSFPADTELLIEGKRIFQYWGCEVCHGEKLQGLVYLDNPAPGHNWQTGEFPNWVAFARNWRE